MKPRRRHAATFIEEYNARRGSEPSEVRLLGQPPGHPGEARGDDRDVLGAAWGRPGVVQGSLHDVPVWPPGRPGVTTRAGQDVPGRPWVAAGTSQDGPAAAAARARAPAARAGGRATHAEGVLLDLPTNAVWPARNVSGPP